MREIFVAMLLANRLFLALEIGADIHRIDDAVLFRAPRELTLTLQIRKAVRVRVRVCARVWGSRARVRVRAGSGQG